MPDAPSPDDLAAVQRAWSTIDTAGGIVGRGDLERDWSLSRQRVHELTSSATFPAPIAEVNGSPVWLRAATSTWRATPRRGGRPRKTPVPATNRETSGGHR